MGKRKRNRGQYVRGVDSRRHLLTREERRQGGKRVYQMFLNGEGKLRDPKANGWYFRKIRGHYRHKGKQ